MKKSIYLVAGIVIFLTGCSSTPKFKCNMDTRRVTIITEPTGAMVTQINPFHQPSTLLGSTPIRDRSVMIVSKITKMKNMSFHETKKLMEQVDNVVVRIEKDGYETYYGTLRTDPQETVIHTIELQLKE